MINLKVILRYNEGSIFFEPIEIEKHFKLSFTPYKGQAIKVHPLITLFVDTIDPSIFDISTNTLTVTSKQTYYLPNVHEMDFSQVNAVEVGTNALIEFLKTNFTGKDGWKPRLHKLYGHKFYDNPPEFNPKKWVDKFETITKE